MVVVFFGHPLRKWLLACYWRPESSKTADGQAKLDASKPQVAASSALTLKETPGQAQIIHET